MPRFSPRLAIAALSCVALVLSAVLLLTAAGASTRTRVVSDCVHPHYKPHRFIVACGDGSYYLIHLRWRHWGRHYAYATGTARANDCTPSCAQGTFHSYAVRFKLTRRGHCAARNDLEYQHYSIHYPHRRPGSPPDSSRAVYAGCN
ncbi:MAG: hypothetical protein QOJ79_1913 [Actinomycetota bacterium]|jgi:hypothetical protein|nr:hypothetical protein [Actinomycetota bacterium]